MTGSVADAAAAVNRSSARFSALLRSGLDGERSVVDSTWTIGDLGGHLASGAMAYRQVAEGEASPYTDLNDRAATNQARLEAESHTDLRALADVIDAEAARAVSVLEARPEGSLIAWHGGISMPVRAVLGAMVGEFQLHGMDLARTVRSPWRIHRRDALPAIDFFNAVTPHLLDHEAVQNVSAIIEVRYRGYVTSTFAFRDGALTVTPGRAAKADVHLSVDPVSFLLVGYKRSGLAKPILTGRALAWGRRPRLALRFPALFQAP